MAQCDCDDPELMDQIMTSMDTNNDGRISFEEFRSGIHTVSKQLTKPTSQSTPDNRQGMIKILKCILFIMRLKIYQYL